jgi:hypothetical protein
MNTDKPKTAVRTRNYSTRNVIFDPSAPPK